MKQENLLPSFPSWHPKAKGSPWKPVKNVDTGRLIFYYSPEFAALPCRDVTKLADSKSSDGERLADNKSDPNLETMTFGMWSTCDQSYRQTIGTKNGGTLFFRTNWPTDPVITGFYDLGWYLDSWYLGAPGKKKGVRILHDRFLAAKRAHFVAEPIPLPKVAAAIGKSLASLKRRSVIEFTKDQTKTLRELLLEQTDATNNYIREIHRLENCNYASTNTAPGAARRYVNWDRVDGFDWMQAKACVNLAQRPKPTPKEIDDWNKAGIIPGKWKCKGGCGVETESPRAIKLCSKCKDGGYVVPMRRT